MAKYVDIVWLSSAIHNFCKGSPITEDNIHHLISLAPTLEERKVGKWIVNKEKDTIYCPFCNTRQKIGTAEVELLDTVFTGFKFCKYCGADMRGAENGSN